MTERRCRYLLWAILVSGVCVAVVIAYTTHGDPYDIESLRLVRRSLEAAPLGVYTGFARAGTPRWPYPPGFFPVIFLAGRLAHAAVPFEFLIRLPSIAADAALAWVVHSYLGCRGADARTRLSAVALVSLGPSFLAISGFHGQIDAVAILPAAIALYVWDRPSSSSSRALPSGLLIGVGAAIKTVPGLFVLALLPSARSKREGATLMIAALAPTVLAFAPYALTGGLPPLHIFLYRGLPGAGGLSLAVQPDVAVAVLKIGPEPFSPLSVVVANHGAIIVVVGLALVAFVGYAARPPARVMAVVLWLSVYTFGVNFFFQYVLWGLPFFLMAGYVREVAVVQAALLGPTLIFYLRPWHRPIVAIVYAALMILVWAAACAGLAAQGRKLLRHRTVARSTAH